MSETITGTVQSKRKDGKGVKINDAWYSSRNASYFGSVNRHDTVTLQFDRNGQWNNCDESIPPVVSAGAAPSGGGGGGGFAAKQAAGAQFRSVDELIRTDALNSSIAFLEKSGELTGDFADNVTKLLKTSELFVAYTKGLVDPNAGQAPAPAAAPPAAPAQPAPPPQPEAPPAPAPAAPAAPSALSTFLGS